MKRTPAAVALIAFALTANAYDNEPSGFRGIEWGTPIESVSEQFTLSESQDRRKFYTRLGDKLTVGGAELRSIGYFFFDGKFAGVMLRSTPGTANRSAMRDAFLAQFGSGFRPNRYMERWLWQGSVTTIFLECEKIRDACTAILQSKQQDELERAEKAARAREAKKDF